MKQIIRAEREPNIPLSTFRRAKALRSGFLSSSWVIYGFGEKADSNYLSDSTHILYMRRLNKDAEVFDNKILFQAIYGGMLDIPPNLCLINRGKVLPLAGSDLAPTIGSVLDWCKRRGPMIWKPTAANAGQGVHRISYDSKGSFSVDGTPATENDILELSRTRDDFLMCPAVVQGKYAATIFPDTVNTVRVWTMREPPTGKAFLAAAAHRFGTTRSRPVDNWAAGGLVAPIDLESGILYSATPKPKAGRVEWFDHHPDSGARIAGIVIPNWNAVISRLEEVTEAYPNIAHCAWDVVVREDGFAVLEGNNWPTMTMLQLRHGILENARVRRFFDHYHLLG